MGLVDLLHTLAYFGMGVFPGYTANLPTQLWIAARFLECGGFLVAALNVRDMPNAGLTVGGFSLATVGLLVSVFVYPVFPDCYLPETGLTPFKRWAEYAVWAVFLLSALQFWRVREQFDSGVFGLLLGGLATTVVAELAFTVYVDVHGPVNMSGHLLKIGSFS